MGKYTRVVSISALTFLSQVPCMQMQKSCTNADNCSDTEWVQLWYIWLVIAICGLFLFCGIACLCVRCCCLKCYHAREETNHPPYEVTVIAFDRDSSTLQSTITSLQSVLGPAAMRILAVAHAQSAVQARSQTAGTETPPVYEEAIHMNRFTVARSRERPPELQPVSEEKSTTNVHETK
ncbi:transmembrane protein 52B [Anolis sagrei]|uniref:transmembrane protein 52B n=1 Tax=Anolis sagrei TaxID=38937 RepID=UPI00352249D2